MPKKSGESDEGPRALLTDREREIVSGEADVRDSYRYQTISRVRRRFDRIKDDMHAMDAHGKLGDEVRDVVCSTDRNTRRCRSCGDTSKEWVLDDEEGFLCTSCAEEKYDTAAEEWYDVPEGYNA